MGRRDGRLALGDLVALDALSPVDARRDARTRALHGTRRAVTGDMTTSTRDEYLARDSILKLLSDDEIAKVSVAETAASLSEGDEYLDLEKPGEGVQRADGIVVPIGRVLPKKAVHADTWRQLLAELGAQQKDAASKKVTQ